MNVITSPSNRGSGILSSPNQREWYSDIPKVSLVTTKAMVIAIKLQKPFQTAVTIAVTSRKFFSERLPSANRQLRQTEKNNVGRIKIGTNSDISKSRLGRKLEKRDCGLTFVSKSWLLNFIFEFGKRISVYKWEFKHDARDCYYYYNSTLKNKK